MAVLSGRILPDSRQPGTREVRNRPDLQRQTALGRRLFRDRHPHLKNRDGPAGKKNSAVPWPPGFCLTQMRRASSAALPV